MPVAHEALTPVPVMDLAWPVEHSAAFASAWAVAVRGKTATTARRQIRLSPQTERKHVLTRVVGAGQPREAVEQLHQQSWMLAYADVLMRPALWVLVALAWHLPSEVQSDALSEV